MAGALISGMVSLLSKPGFIPAGLEEEGQKLLAQFSLIQPVLADAETRAVLAAVDARAYDEILSKWLTDLNVATCGADALLDKLNYEKLCAEAENDGQAADGVSTGLLSLCKISSRRKNTFQNEIRTKLKEIISRMDNIVKSIEDFGFEKGAKEEVDSVAFASGEFEFTEPEEVEVGSETKMDKILSLLFGPVRETTTVISIVGMGESARKTLAHLAFSKAKASQQFELLLWINISQTCKVANVFKRLIDQAIGKDCCLSEADLDLLQHRLRQELSGRRYLIVLNDVSEDTMLEVFELLSNHGVGSFVIVTTPSRGYGYRLGSHIFRPVLLNEDDSWELFRRRGLLLESVSIPSCLIFVKLVLIYARERL